MTFTPELISLFGGAFSGFIFRYWAEQASSRNQITELLIKRQDAADKSSDSASKREQSSAGQYVRRFLVISVMVAVALFPFILTLLHEPTVVSETTPIRNFFGVFEWGGREKFYELYGYFLSPELKLSLLAIVGYYFGNASARTR